MLTLHPTIMRFIKLENNIPINYTIEQLFIDHPNAVIYEYNNEMPEPKLLEKYNVYPLVTTRMPEDDVVEEGVPEFKDNEWYQTWTSRPFTAEEIAKNKADADYRFNICKSCDQFVKLTSHCRVCKCIMLVKVKFKVFHCPLGKW